MSTDEYQVTFVYENVVVTTLSYLDHWGEGTPEEINQRAIGQAQDRLAIDGINPYEALEVTVKKTGEYA